MNIAWVAVILLILLLYAGYQWKFAKRRSTQRPPKSSVTRDEPTETGSLTRRPSVYSLSGRSLSAPKDRFKSSVSFQSPVAKSFQQPTYTSNRTTFPVLTAQLKELAIQAWTTGQSFRSQLLLNPVDFVNISEPAQVVEVLIRHARRITPGFSVPHMVPRVLVVSLPTAAGMFKVDEEG